MKRKKILRPLGKEQSPQALKKPPARPISGPPMRLVHGGNTLGALKGILCMPEYAGISLREKEANLTSYFKMWHKGAVLYTGLPKRSKE
jgi:hypothetical protein